MTPTYFALVDRPGTWLTDGSTSIKLLRVSRGFDYGSIDGFRHSWWVGATFDLKQAEPGPMEDGVNMYGYILVRNKPTEPWRIGDEGLG